MSAPLTASPPSAQPLARVHEGSNLAALCRQIVLSSVVQIQNKNYLKVEGWMSIAAADHCTPEIVKVECVSVMKGGIEVQGVRAEAILKRDSDGYVISRGYGFVGEDEYSENFIPSYFVMEAKAQTRAVSRVCRHKYAFVLGFIDQSIQPTPADEVPPDGFPSQTNATNTKAARTWRPAPPQTQEAQTAPRLGSAQPPSAPAETIWDGMIREVRKKEGIKQTGPQTGQPYTLWIIKMADGREALTFDEKLGEMCGKAAGYQNWSLAVKPNKAGKFHAVELLPARNHQEASAVPQNEDQDEYNE